MNRLILGVLVIVALCTGCARMGDPSGGSAPVSADRVIAEAFGGHQSGVAVHDSGTVTRVLADDNNGGRHQRFVLRLASGQTLLIAHNIDIAPRLGSLNVGDSVEFSGIYEWNAQGGVVHWTHHDPSGEHQPGWLKHNGVVSQ